ncbi:MAG: alpha/beta hydrolase family protein [Nitrospiraceae bacterium]
MNGVGGPARLDYEQYLSPIDLHPTRVPNLVQFPAMVAIEQALIFTDPAGRAVAGILATPPTATDRVVVLCHGFLSNKNSNTNKTLTPLLIERGIATFRFDFLGQGESQGPFEQITVTAALDQARAALELVSSMGYRRLGLIGSSFGGLIATLAAGQALEHGASLFALAQKCPVPDFPEMLRLEFGEAGMERWKQADEIPNVAGGGEPIALRFSFYIDSLAHDAYKAAEVIQAPVLIVQGDADEYVPLHQCRRLYDALRATKRLEILPGADHGFSKPEDFRTMTALLADWMIQHLPA